MYTICILYVYPMIPKSLCVLLCIHSIRYVYHASYACIRYVYYMYTLYPLGPCVPCPRCLEVQCCVPSYGVPCCRSLCPLSSVPISTVLSWCCLLSVVYGCVHYGIPYRSLCPLSSVPICIPYGVPCPSRLKAIGSLE